MRINVCEKHLLAEFAKPVRDIAISERLAQAITDLLKRSHRKAIAAYRRTMDGYKNAIASLRQREDELFDDLKNGLFDEDTYCRRRDDIRAEQGHNMQQLERGQE